MCSNVRSRSSFVCHGKFRRFASTLPGQGNAAIYWRHGLRRRRYTSKFRQRGVLPGAEIIAVETAERRHVACVVRGVSSQRTPDASGNSQSDICIGRSTSASPRLEAGLTIKQNDLRFTRALQSEKSSRLEAGAGIEPANSGFADRDLTTWLPRQIARWQLRGAPCKCQCWRE
jgi:hypothetical protein